MTAHLPALTSNWETLAAEGFDSVDALRLAGAEDLVDVGFEQDAAEGVLRALQAGAAEPAPAPEPEQKPEPAPEPEPEPEPEQKLEPEPEPEPKRTSF